MNARHFKRARPTIGILPGWSTLEGSTPDRYRVSVMNGIQTAAKSRGCDVFISWGIRRILDIHKVYPAWPVVSSESDFIPVGPWNMDGLIVFTPLVSWERSNYLQMLQADGYPVLFIGTGEKGPQIATNSSEGIRQAVAHLAEHGHRRVAFIAGSSSDKGDSETRLNAYLAAVEEYHLEADPGLIVWGWHAYRGGYQALQTLLASKVKFTAVLASNDTSAIGAMRAIHDAGLNVPHDIAVMGFDNQPEALAQVPPLSSVHVPLELMGEQALIMMADHLSGKIPLSSMQISTRIMQRQSCGCIPDVVSSAMDSTSKLPFRPAEDADLQEKQEYLAKEMLNVLPALLRFPGEDEIYALCTMLVGAFCKSLDELTPIHFQTAFIDCINQLEKADKSLNPWQEMVSVLRREMTILPVLAENHARHQLAEDLLHLARAAIGESAERQSQRHQYQRAVNALALNTLTASLSAVLNENQIVEVLNIHLASVGIQHARILFFQPEGNDPVGRSILLNPGSALTPEPFPTRQFPPDELYTSNELLYIVLIPLVFQDEVLGYVALDARNDLGACAVVSTQLAATIKVARLHETVVGLSLTDALTGLHNRRYFELFLKNEVDRSKRFSRGLGLILVDCDNFKEYNDTYGHPAGDEALQQLAKCLSAGRQHSDTVARIGGDEFVLVLPETELSGALEASRKIRAAVAQLSTLKRHISVSIGLVALHQADMDAESIIQQADVALYESKRRGKNRISFFCNQRAFDEKDFPLSS